MPVKAKALRFVVDGKVVFAKKVTIPGTHYMKRAFDIAPTFVKTRLQDAVDYFIKQL